MVEHWSAWTGFMGRWGRIDGPALQTEGSIDRDTRLSARIDDDWGRSGSLDPDNVGDIADEGAGHRG
jgi:hypothetical protein